MSGTETLTAGQTLKIPNTITNIHNDYATFKPYNPGEIIGDTTPKLPDPPPPPQEKGGSCGGFGQVLSIVVAAVATYFLGPIGGNLVSQAFNNLIGTQHGFSFSSFASAAIIPQLKFLPAGTPAGEGFGFADVARAAATNAISQGIAIVTGEQEKFSWTGLATAAISAPLTKGIDDHFSTGAAAPAPLTLSNFGNNLESEFFKGVTRESVNILVNRGGKFDWTQVAADAFGNAFGNSIVADIRHERKVRAEKARADANESVRLRAMVNFKSQALDDIEAEQRASAFESVRLQAMTNYSKQQAHVDDHYPVNLDFGDVTVANNAPAAEVEREVLNAKASSGAAGLEDGAQRNTGRYLLFNRPTPYADLFGITGYENFAPPPRQRIDNSPVPLAPVPGETYDEPESFSDSVNGWLNRHSTFSLRPYDEDNVFSLGNADAFVYNLLPTVGNIPLWLLNGAADALDALKIPPTPYTEGIGILDAGIVSLRGLRAANGIVADSAAFDALTNQTSRASRAWGINFFRESGLRAQMARTEAGQRVLSAADSGEINLLFSAEDASASLLGRSYGNNATVFVRNTQNGTKYELLGVKASGYEFTAGVAIHEGLHALGVAGSQRAEALVRLAELENIGVPINRSAMRQVLTDMKGNYNKLPWKVGRTTPNFPGIEF